MKRKDWIIIIGVIVAVAILLWLLLRKKDEPQKSDVEDTQTETKKSDLTPYCSNISGTLNRDLIMKIQIPYLQGKEVCVLQKYLNTMFNSGLQEDGIFGPKTKTALQKNLFLTEASLNDVANAHKEIFSNQPVTISWGSTQNFAS